MSPQDEDAPVNASQRQGDALVAFMLGGGGEGRGVKRKLLQPAA